MSRAAVRDLGGARRVVLAAVGVALFLGVWHAAVVIYDLSRLVLPTPWAVLEQLGRMVRDGDFWYDVGVSLYEFAAGYAIGVIGGIALGVVVAEIAPVRMALHPVIEGFRFVVPFAWISLTVLWFGTSYWGKLLLVAYAVFFVMVISTREAVRGVDRTLLDAATMLGMPRYQRALLIQLRAAAPMIASAARAAAAIGWIAVVAAEYVGSRAGLGNLIINATTAVETSVVIAAMVAIGLIGAAISAVIGGLATRWLAYDQ